MRDSELFDPNVQLAVELIKRGAKTFVTIYVTGLPESRVRSLWKLIRGEQPRRGMIPSLARIARTHTQMVEVSLYLAFYRQYAKTDPTQEVDFWAWVRAHDEYLRCRSFPNYTVPADRLLDINAAWQIVMALRGGDETIKLLVCRKCRVTYADFAHAINFDCPVCSWSKSRNRRVLLRGGGDRRPVHSDDHAGCCSSEPPPL